MAQRHHNNIKHLWPPSAACLFMFAGCFAGCVRKTPGKHKPEIFSRRPLDIPYGICYYISVLQLVGHHQGNKETLALVVCMTSISNPRGGLMTIMKKPIRLFGVV